MALRNESTGNDLRAAYPPVHAPHGGDHGRNLYAHPSTNRPTASLRKRASGPTLNSGAPAPTNSQVQPASAPTNAERQAGGLNSGAPSPTNSQIQPAPAPTNAQLQAGSPNSANY